MFLGLLIVFPITGAIWLIWRCFAKPQINFERLHFAVGLVVTTAMVILPPIVILVAFAIMYVGARLGYWQF